MEHLTMPLPKTQILTEIDSALQTFQAELRRLPADKALQAGYSALQGIRDHVMDHWPLTADEKRRINIGIYAVRELEGFSDDLVAQLTTLDTHLTREG
jgi:hypothetical protein